MAAAAAPSVTMKNGAAINAAQNKAYGPMSILEECQEPPNVPAWGTQADSTRRTAPNWKQGTASRDQRKNVWISAQHVQDLVGRDSPGFAYEPKRQKSLPSWGFGTAPQRPAPAAAKYPETSNNLLGKIPDGSSIKYKNPPRPNQAVSSLDAMYNQPGYTGFKAGVVSPGPMRYTPSAASTRCIKHGHAPDIHKTPPCWSLSFRTKLIEETTATGEKVGPANYTIPQAHGQQPDSKESKPEWKLYRHDRFPEGFKKKDAGRIWDVDGKQKEMNSRKFSRPPSFSFGTASRDKIKKTHPAHTKADRGPAADMPDFRSRSMPELPRRKDVMRFSDVPAG